MPNGPRGKSLQRRLIPLKWDSAVLDLVPRWCLRCETQIVDIRLYFDQREDAYHVFCGHCRHLLRSLSGPAMLELRESRPKQPV